MLVGLTVRVEGVNSVYSITFHFALFSVYLLVSIKTEHRVYAIPRGFTNAAVVSPATS